MGNETTGRSSITFGEIALALASEYDSFFVIDAEDDSYIEYLTQGDNRELVQRASGESFHKDVVDNCLKMVHPDERDVFLGFLNKDNFREVLESGKSCSFSCRLIMNDEPLFYSMKIMRGSERKVIFVIQNADEEIRRELDEDTERFTYQYIAGALASQYEVIYYINTRDNSYTQYSSSDEYAKLGTTKQGADFFKDAAEDIKKYIHRDDVKRVLRELEKEHLLKNLRESGAVNLKYRQLLGDRSKYVSMSVVIPKNDPNHVVMGVTNIDAQVRRELSMMHESEVFNEVSMALASRYEAIYRVNVSTNEYYEYSTSEKYAKLKIGSKGNNFFAETQENMKRDIYVEDQPMMAQAMEKEYLLEKLSQEGKVYLNYRLMLDGRPQFMTLIIVRPKEDSEHIIVALENIDEAKRREMEFEDAIDSALDMANKDALTGVKNKHAYAKVEMQIDDLIAEEEQDEFAVVVCDINGLKEMNDENGHLAGDEYIRSACTLICNTFKHSPVFRIGGDEFVVLLKGEDFNNRRSLLEGFGEKQMENKQKGLVTLAFGISEFDASKDMRLQDVFERADNLMYENKDRFKKFGKIDKNTTESVREAMKKKELVAFYQPQYDTITGEIVCAEALVRWIKPNGLVIPPMDFIPEMEQTDAINEMDWYVLRETCETWAMLRGMGIMIPISINFSRWHVHEKDFADRLNGIVDHFEIPHKYIEVEITESALIIESKMIRDWVCKVRDAGYSVAIDDFGSGYSSLQFVKDVPVDVVKIDKSLLSHNCEDEKERVVLESIFYFAHRLNLKTVAEGVETNEQLSFLRACSCVRIQGFLFAKPMEREEFLKICAEKSQGHDPGDILEIQAPSSATKLLMDAVFMKYPLIIFCNLTRNTFYMMAYENFTATSCPSTGNIDDLIAHGAATMHPDCKEAFATTFSRENLLKLYNEGKKSVSLLCRQMGDDGIYREVEVIDYFVKHPSVDDVLVISLCDNRE